VSPRSWKFRLFDIIEAIEKVNLFCIDLNTSEEFKNELKTFDACIKNLEVIGEATSKIPNEIKKEYPTIPWKQIKGMRNILAHEYFGANAAVIWTTIKSDLPQLKHEIEKIVQKYETTTHPWRICPIGEYYVSGSDVDEHPRAQSYVKGHPRRSHCRQSKNIQANVLNASEIKLITTEFILPQFKNIKLKNYGFKDKDHKYDPVIAGWTKYWNDIFNPKIPLEADFVKALIASESSFNPDPWKGDRKKAMGIGQLVPTTIKSLQGYKKELKDHLIEINGDDAFDTDANIAALVRWLHQKQKLATHTLKREATWLEAVENYKGQLKKSKNSESYKESMSQFLYLLKRTP